MEDHNDAATPPTGQPEITLASAEVAQPSARQEQVQTKTPSHPPYLVETAVNLLGYGQEELQSMTTPELERMVQYASRVRTQQFREMQEMQRAYQAQQQTARQTPEPVQEESIWGVSPEGNPLTERDFLPPVRNTVKAIPEIRRENAALRKKLEEIENHIRNQGAQSQRNLIDSAFDNLGKEYSAIFGKGSISNYRPDDVEVTMRNAVLASVGVPPESPEFMARFRASAQKIRARLAPVGETNGSAPKNRVSGYEIPDIDEWNAGALAPTTQRKAPAGKMTDYERIKAEVDAERAAMGGQVVTPGGDDYGDLLV